MIENPSIIKGGIYCDSRGVLKFVNDFTLDNTKRFYVIYGNKGNIRAWQGHQKECKYFYPIKGEFKIYTIKIDDWTNPAENLKPREFTLSEKSSEILKVPSGYANGIFTLENDSILLVFSSLIIDEAKKDLFRFNQNLWVDWVKKLKELG